MMSKSKSKATIHLSPTHDIDMSTNVPAHLTSIPVSSDSLRDRTWPRYFDFDLVAFVTNKEIERFDPSP
jgi:hypothetical protein